MNPAAEPRDKNLWSCVLLGRIFAGILMFTASVMVAGCGSSARLVKENLDPKPLFANALSRAMCFAGDKEKCSPKSNTGFPAVPLDENNATVKQFVKEYAYGQRETMKRYLAQAEVYLPMVKSMAKEHGLPQDLAYLFLLESGANPEARSPANALGMWQFMPATARSYGLRVDSWVDERLDPEKSTQAALVYLKDLYGMFGCWRLAISAYNSGENKLNQVLCQEDAGEYDEICSSPRLKRETREFLPRFQAIAHIARNSDKYGFSQQSNRTDDTRYESALIQGSYSAAKLASILNISEDELLEMNPALIRGVTPPEPHYKIRVPRNKKAALLAELRQIEPEQKQQHIVHVVGKGDNVHKIVSRYGVHKTQLAHLNPDVNFARKLRNGTKIIVPAQKTQTKEQRGTKKGKRLSRL